MLKYAVSAALAAVMLSACGQTATTTEAAAPTLPPCAGKTYSVYFPYQDSNLTPEAAQVVDAVLTDLQSCSAQTIKVSAHSDTDEGQSSPAVSQARGAGVQTYLTSHGVSASIITVEDLKDTQPPVNTGPGVKEPLNRSVNIEINGGFH